MKTPFLTGKNIYLRGLKEEDLNGPYFDWFNDAEVCKGNSHHRFPNSVQKMKSYFDSVSLSKTDLVLAICETKTDCHLGNIAIQGIDWINRSGEYAIILGDKSCWGKGYGLEASLLIVSHAFSQLNLQRIYCGTPSQNQGMRSLAVKIGMKEEGRQRQAFFRDGVYDDVILFGILSSEFKG